MTYSPTPKTPLLHDVEGQHQNGGTEQLTDSSEASVKPKTDHRTRSRPLAVRRVLVVCVVVALMLLAVRAIWKRTSLYNHQACFKVSSYGFARPVSTSGANGTVKGLPTHYTLPSGDRIPSVALGMWKTPKGQACSSATAALAAGYRHIDGAWIYKNEEEVGQAIKDSGVPRTDIWLTSKLWNNFHAPEDVEAALDDSLKKLQTEYLDLYLIHWPIAFKKAENVYEETLSENPFPTWQKLEEMVDKGKVRNIGISNFNIRRIKNLTANPLKYKPAVLQVEMNFWNPQTELLKWTKKNDLLIESYSPLGSNDQVKRTLQVPEVVKIADELGITPAQAVISWHVQRGTVVLPKSVHTERIEENMRITHIPDELFDQLEKAAGAHQPMRVVNPSKGWGLDFDVFDD